MKRFAQIEGNRVHWVFESEERPEFAPNIILVEVTGLSPTPQEGWSYNPETGKFSEPIIEEPTELRPTLEEKLARMEQQLQDQSLIQLEVLATIFEELLMKG